MRKIASGVQRELETEFIAKCFTTITIEEPEQQRDQRQQRR